ncbi:MAG: aspartate carbamoyltransferase catalytic subunit [Ignavibacteriae bacterium]|nr:aspartate carbamoyltransferase catalytic subunit [Ignavibacteriota bacterium]
MRSLLDIASLSKKEVLDIFNLASNYLIEKKDDVLQGKNIVIGFFESSTRTRISFDLAVQRLGGKTIQFLSQGSSISKGESFVDTIHTLNQFGIDGWIIRHNHALAPSLVASETQLPVINAGDGSHQHPTQAMLDAFTISRHLGDLVGKNILIVGDILHSRVARSEMDLLSLLGASVGVCAPGTLLPKGMKIETFFPTLHQGVQWADAVIMLRLQKERMVSGIIPSEDEYQKYFGMNEAIIKTYSNVLILHPGPANYGVEFAMECMNYENVLVREQVKNGLALRMAVLNHCFL